VTTDRPWRWTWIVALSTAVAIAFGAVFYSLSVLVTDEAAGAEFSATALSLAYSGFVVTSGGLAWLVGRIADRRGVRPLVVVGSAIGGLGMLALGRIDAPWHAVVIATLLLGPAGALTFYEVAFVAVDRWYGPEHRARALASLTVIGGLAGPVFLPLTGALVGTVGWRTATVVLGAILFGAALLASAALPSPHPPPPRAGAAPPRWHELAADRRFVLFTLSTVLLFGAIQAVFFHRVAVFDDAGFSLTVVTAWAAVSSLLSLPGRWIGPFLAERLGATRLYAAAVVCIAAAALAASEPNVWTMAVHFTVFGVAFGATLPIRAVVMSRWYSGEYYGRIMGLQWTSAAFAGAVFPALAGWLRDATGSYAWPMAVLAAVFVVAAASGALAGRTR
jgi:MFS family permease